jgi:hypothetical protein
MISRRGFAKLLAALPFCGGLAKVLADNSGGFAPAAGIRSAVPMNGRPEQKGVLGTTYFSVDYHEYDFKEIYPGKSIYLDGEEIIGRCTEFDAVAGWAGLLRGQIDAKGKMALAYPPHHYIQYGHVEIR